jgi:tRNA threonylcarbamoyladenosine biosynthesis protein TsaB
MIILALDTSSRLCSLAVLGDGELLSSTGGVSDEPYASRVFADLNRVMAQARVELAQIELFAVATGPGAFTGLRVGLAAVKGWSEVFGRPVAAVSVLESIAAQAQATRPAQMLAPVMDARGGHLYGGLFRRDETDGRLLAMAEEVVLSHDEYFRWVRQVAGSESPLFVTTTPEMVKAALAPSSLAGAALEEVSGELAPSIGRLGLARSRRGELVDSLALEANYVRRSDAETKWRGG